MDEDRQAYLDIKQMVKRELRDVERVYVDSILQKGIESGNNKAFWKYVYIKNHVVYLLLKQRDYR